MLRINIYAWLKQKILRKLREILATRSIIFLLRKKYARLGKKLGQTTKNIEKIRKTTEKSKTRFFLDIQNYRKLDFLSLAKIFMLGRCLGLKNAWSYGVLWFSDEWKMRYFVNFRQIFSISFFFFSSSSSSPSPSPSRDFLLKTVQKLSIFFGTALLALRLKNG